MDSIITTNLTKKFKDKCAVDHVDLNVRQGELFGLLGTNGAGKTTTIKMLTTLLAPTEGEVEIQGIKLLNQNLTDIRKLINISPQETAIAPNLTVLENLQFMAGVYEIENKDERIAELIKTFNLDDVLKQKAKTLSGGWQRKLSIAIALINSPKILFLDEPTLGLDVIARRELWSVIEGLKGDITIILTTHYMEEAESLCDRIAIMAKGEIKEIGTPDELKAKAQTDNFEEAFVALATKAVEA